MRGRPDTQPRNRRKRACVKGIDPWRCVRRRSVRRGQMPHPSPQLWLRRSPVVLRSTRQSIDDQCRAVPVRQQRWRERRSHRCAPWSHATAEAWPGLVNGTYATALRNGEGWREHRRRHAAVAGDALRMRYTVWRSRRPTWLSSPAPSRRIGCCEMSLSLSAEGDLLRSCRRRQAGERFGSLPKDSKTVINQGGGVGCGR